MKITRLALSKGEDCVVLDTGEYQTVSPPQYIQRAPYINWLIGPLRDFTGELLLASGYHRDLGLNYAGLERLVAIYSESPINGGR
jgi:hypothetical protein